MAKRIETLQVQVGLGDCDQNGHMSASAYMGFFADASFSMVTRLGVGPAEARRRGVGLTAVRAEIDFVAEALAGDVLRCETELEALGAKKIVFRHELSKVGAGDVVARARATTVFLDLATRRAVPVPDEVRGAAGGSGAGAGDVPGR